MRFYSRNYRTPFLALATLTPALLFASSSGPIPFVSGDPLSPDKGATCNQSGCHTGTAVNVAGAGSVVITTSGAGSYVPGQTQTITVTVADPKQKAWGFQLTARVTSSNAQAGDLNPTDGSTWVQCADGSQKRSTGCAALFNQQFIEHTQPKVSSGSGTFTFSWTAPATAVGSITMYAAGNAANYNQSETGDHIYTTSITLTPAAANTPTISTGGVFNAAGYQQNIAAGSWIAIAGTNLSATTRSWTASDFGANGAFPTSLDGVSVTINNKPAFVQYISPTQINVQAPTDTATGPVPVQVKNANGTSTVANVNLQTVSPAFFLWNYKYAATTTPNYTYVGPPNLFGSALVTTPAKPGDIVIFWGSGFGPTTPAVAAGNNTPSTSVANTSNPVTVTIGGISANVLGAALTPGNAGVYQVAVQVPSNAPNGDLAVVAQIAGVQSPSNVFLTIQAP